MHIEYFFDCSSPWTYLSFSRICKLLARYEFELKLRPILVGGIFNTINPSVYDTRDHPVAVKQRYYSKDLADWARYEGISIGSPPVFPNFVASRTQPGRPTAQRSRSTLAAKATKRYT